MFCSLKKKKMEGKFSLLIHPCIGWITNREVAEVDNKLPFSLESAFIPHYYRGGLIGCILENFSDCFDIFDTEIFSFFRKK